MNTTLQQLDVEEMWKENVAGWCVYVRACGEVWEIFGSLMKLTFSLMAPSISRTGEFGEWKISMLQYHHPSATPKVMAWATISSKGLTGLFFPMAFWVEFWRYKILRKIMGATRGSCNMVFIHI